ncbi:unnamed protein product [Closterium sp. Yama58-4]|nr:unnamed protein product [Closterium sp. Yama58-4]
MVGSQRYISNVITTPTATYVTVANNNQLPANAQGIVMLQVRDNNTHFTFNDVLYVPNLRLNLLSAGQLSDCGVTFTTDPLTRDLELYFAPPDTPVEDRKYLGRARSIIGVYVLDFDLPDCRATLDELADLIPLDFAHKSENSWNHLDVPPWIRRNPHPGEMNIYSPGPDGRCTSCFTPTVSRTEKVEREVAAIEEAESDAPPTKGMTEIELATASYRVFGNKQEELGVPEAERLGPASETV